MGKKLKKNLGFFDVVAFGIGPMLSSGIFLLPGIVFAKVGPSAILAYVVAAILIIPALLSKAELATAMPKAGGAYYFLDRSMGPLIGTISGFGTWMSLAFKSAFDLIGLGAYLVLFVDLPIKPVAASLCVVFAVLSISGVKNVGRFQGIFVSLLLGLMTYFITKGFFFIEPAHFKPFFVDAKESFLGAVGLVYVSFAGLTKIASVAEEVEDLDRNIPYGMMVALIVTIIVYVLGLIVMIGVDPGVEFAHSLTPVVDAAQKFLGPVGRILMTAAAILAFVASANAGITAASRYPLAMSRDNLLNDYWKKIGRFNTPTRSILLTMGLMICFILILSPVGIAKLGSAFKLLIFGMLNLAVIVMRESKITAYDPGYKTKLYPWAQIVGILSPVILIPELGILPMILSGGVVICGALWYYLYAKKRVDRSAAMYQVFERVGAQATPQLYEELRDIIREKGTRREDIFEQCVLRAGVVLHRQGQSYQEVLEIAASIISKRLDLPVQTVFQELSNIEDVSLGNHLALPHAKIEKAEKPELVIIHSKDGIKMKLTEEEIYAMLVLVSPSGRPRQHLRFLAELANRAEQIDFSGGWRNLSDNDMIRNTFIRAEDYIEVAYPGKEFQGTRIGDLPINRDCLIAVINRNGESIVPHGDTKLETGDKLTIVGKKEAVKELVSLF
ncbi:MAG: amino acid permease [Balneolaceae bacterium]|jgi:amino acid transporter/mannitol/fructose-specific phosphotransferase system IIA component (Ntr-type)